MTATKWVTKSPHGASFKSQKKNKSLRIASLQSFFSLLLLLHETPAKFL
jgi:hypothetical protein